MDDVTPVERAPDRAHRARHGLVASTFATFTALYFHVAGGGEFPSWLGIVAPWVLASTVCVLLAGRKPSLLRIGISVGVSQFAFHGLFMLAAPSGASLSGGHVHGAVAAMPPMSAHDHGTSSMTVAHVVAAVLTTAVLYQAERVWAFLRHLVATVVSWFRARLDVVVPTSGRAHRLPVVARIAPAPAGYFAVTSRRRGPPSLLVA